MAMPPEYSEHYFKSRYSRGLKGFRPWLFVAYLRSIRKIVTSGAVADIGCGLGHWSWWWRRFGGDRHGFSVVACDISEVAVRETYRRMRAAVRADCTRLPFSDGSLVAVTAIDVIEHLADPVSLLREVSRVLRLGGVLVLQTPNPLSLGHRWKGKQWAGWADPTHVQVKPPDEWRAMLLIHAFETKDTYTTGLWDSPYVSLVPSVLQHLFFRGLTIFAILFGVRLPLQFGEDIIIVAQKAREG